MREKDRERIKRERENEREFYSLDFSHMTFLKALRGRLSFRVSSNTLSKIFYCCFPFNVISIPYIASVVMSINDLKENRCIVLLSKKNPAST